MPSQNGRIRKESQLEIAGINMMIEDARRKGKLL